MFKQLEDITKYCYENGIFIVLHDTDRKLAQKVNNDDFSLYDIRTLRDGTKVNAIAHFREQLYYNICNPAIEWADIIKCIPHISLNTFAEYDKRQSEIEDYKIVLNDLKNSKFKLFGKTTNLIYGVKYMQDMETGKYRNINSYFNIIDGELIPIDARQLSDKDKAKATEVKNIAIIENALSDSMKNQYSEIYNEQCRIWESLKGVKRGGNS